VLSVLDIFRVGIGPSSSHTVGPIRIGKRFVERLRKKDELGETHEIYAVLQGSLAFTGKGHHTPKAVILGLLGLKPETLDPAEADALVARVYQDHKLKLGGEFDIDFDPEKHIVFDYETRSNIHPNGIKMRALSKAGKSIAMRTYFSTGGGFIASKQQLQKPIKDDLVKTDAPVPFAFGSAAELLAHCGHKNKAIHEIIYANEDSKRPRIKTDTKLHKIAEVMMACINRGMTTVGILPGGLEVNRRAPAIWKKLQSGGLSNEREELFDWLTSTPWR